MVLVRSGIFAEMDCGEVWRGGRFHGFIFNQSLLVCKLQYLLIHPGTPPCPRFHDSYMFYVFFIPHYIFYFSLSRFRWSRGLVNPEDRSGEPQFALRWQKNC